MGGFVIFLMVMSVLALYRPGNDSELYEYNSYRFYSSQQGWFTRVNNQQLYVAYLPNELDNATNIRRSEEHTSELQSH